jgi:hypothetical protein
MDLKTRYASNEEYVNAHFTTILLLLLLLLLIIIKLIKFIIIIIITIIIIIITTITITITRIYPSCTIMLPPGLPAEILQDGEQYGARATGHFLTFGASTWPF